MRKKKRALPLVCGMLALCVWMFCSCSAQEQKEKETREGSDMEISEKAPDARETERQEQQEPEEAPAAAATPAAQEEPAEPTDPAQQPGQPEQSEQPEQPDQPDQPEQPEQPQEAAGEQDPPPEAAPEEETPVLLFEDNFDGTTLDAKKWKHCPNWERGGGACVWDDDYAFLDGEGHLVLRAEYDEDYEVVHSGAVWTKGLFECAYGYYEASICFPTAPGTWGAFWMEIGNLNDPSPTKGLEIDIIESINNEAGLCNHNLHWNYPDLHSVGSGQLKKDIYDGEFHTFGLLRTDQEYVFYIDGRRTWKANARMCEPCPLPGFMELTVEAAEWAGAGSSASVKALPADMLVDYVRVYSAKP